MIHYLESYLNGYKINTNGTTIIFESETEDYYGEFSLKLLLEMYLGNHLERMFLVPAIIPN